MGNFFGSDVDAESTLTSYQEWIEQLLGQNLATILQGSTGGMSGAQRSLLRDIRRPPLGRASRRALRQNLRGIPQDTAAIEDQLLNTFDQRVQPRIDASFARHGASLGSRRGFETARSLDNVTNQIGTLQTQFRESARQRQLQAASIPLQQTLAQIQGLGALQQQQFAPLALSNAFVRNNNQALTSTPGLGQQLLQLGGMGFGAGLFGQPGMRTPGSGGTGIFGMLGK